MSASLIRRLIAAGTPDDLVDEVLQLVSEVGALHTAREKNAARQARFTKRKAEATNVNNVTNVSDVTNVIGDIAADPAPDKSPPHPQKLTPTPCVGDAPTCEADPIDMPIAAKIAVNRASAAFLGALAGGALRDAAWAALGGHLDPALLRREKPPRTGPAPWSCPPGIDPGHWRDFLANRKTKKLTNTPTAYDRVLKRIEQLASDEWPPGRILQEAAERGWGGIYDPRENEQRNGQRSNDDRAGDGHRNPMVRAVVDAAADRAARGEIDMGDGWGNPGGGRC